MALKIFACSYGEHWNYGGFQDYSYVVVANSESEALGLALTAEPETKAKDWLIEEVDTSYSNAFYLYERSN